VRQGFVVLCDQHHFPVNDKDIPVSVDAVDEA
jgi:hypothetical protein